MDDNQNDKDGDLPKFPSDPEIWRYVIAIGIFGALQQFCLIGKQCHKFLFYNTQVLTWISQTAVFIRMASDEGLTTGKES